MHHVHLFTLCLCKKAVFLDFFVSALVAYKTSEYVSIHLVDVHRATVMTLGVSTRIQVYGCDGRFPSGKGWSANVGVGCRMESSQCTYEDRGSAWPSASRVP